MLEMLVFIEAGASATPTYMVMVVITQTVVDLKNNYMKSRFINIFTGTL